MKFAPDAADERPFHRPAGNSAFPGGTSVAVNAGMTPTVRPIAVPVFYATSEGQTRRIAERLASSIRASGLESEAIDVSTPDATRVDWTAVRAAVLGASLHGGRHQRVARKFVDEHAAELNAHPSAFFSVSLSAASQHVKEVDAAQTLAENFPREHGWQPTIFASLAGRLAYTQYGFLKRMVLKRIARHEGAPTDTSRDWEFTNWDKVEELARTVAARAA
jgi:menaquinone-dependent protoporphyrinogen oxidase